MSEFKVGDKVRWVGRLGKTRPGDIGVVSSLRGSDWIEVTTDDRKQSVYRGEVDGYIEACSDLPSENLGGLYDDDVNHPSHYTQYPVEVIEITERLSFLMGNIVKYVLRADHKGEPIKDLKKAQWYLEREIARRERESRGGM